MPISIWFHPHTPMPFQLTGFADEAERSLEGQISTLKELGWNAIELRLIDGKNVCDQSDDEWRQTWEALQSASIKVVGFGGQIANWARPIDSDFQIDIDELARAAPRMRECGAPFLRVMSYPNAKESPFERNAWKSEATRRLKELATIAEGEGIVLGHENCNGYGETPEGFLEMAQNIDSPAFRLIFDTGNNSLHENDIEATWDYYRKCRDWIDHVHIKCAKPNPQGGDYVTCHVDEDPAQARILSDLASTGYDGWLSIEPHIKAAIHAGQDIDDSGEGRRVWVEFAKRLESLIAQQESDK